MRDGERIGLNNLLTVGQDIEIECSGSICKRALTPELRFYLTRQMQTTEAAIQSGLLGNLYVSIGEQDDAGRWTVRLYYHPLVIWIWIGALAMAAGGVLSFAGLVWLITGGNPPALLAGGVHPGDLLMLGAGAAYALYGVLLRRWHCLQQGDFTPRRLAGWPLCEATRMVDCSWAAGGF